MALTKPRAYRVNDFCTAFGIGRTSAYKLIKTGVLKSNLVAGRRLIPADAAEELLKESERNSATSHALGGRNE